MDTNLDFMGRVAKCSTEYLQQALVLKPTAEEFIGWVDTQPSAVRGLLLSLGPAYCWESVSWSYMDYVLSQRGYSVHQYMANQLSECDYLRWIEFVDTATEL
jgi:hypothetical protein